jgi:hypothetical protein
MWLVLVFVMVFGAPAVNLKHSFVTSNCIPLLASWCFPSLKTQSLMLKSNGSSTAQPAAISKHGWTSWSLHICNIANIKWCIGYSLLLYVKIIIHRDYQVWHVPWHGSEKHVHHMYHIIIFTQLWMLNVVSQVVYNSSPAENVYNQFLGESMWC